MTTQHAVEKLANAIDLTTITWRNGTVMQGEYVTIRRKDALVLLQALQPEDKASAPALIDTPAAAVAV
jgi:hypothetical protein